ncbi:hypothetical protein C8Z91_11380 [Paenibacillus elgii]|uniref:Uncharacterized protein n=1 Tax=Paenibacillus elgii TaxID=189691 RepID=A0A2T6G4G7_9BACL|nr:hypothetical protein [Paenibacillus elgii]PUA39067.1 hypothetical protein C8Z91_11380 [Paenibacillus elgii]
METNAALQPLTILQYLALIHQISYTNVCRDVGLTPQQFGDWAKKRRPVPKERLQVLADYFNVDANLLIDENHYLKDLTPELKIDVQIIFIKKMLEKGAESDDMDAYREKLSRLQKEKKKQALLARFAAIIDQDNYTLQLLCESFLENIEQSNFEIIEPLIKEKGK